MQAYEKLASIPITESAESWAKLVRDEKLPSVARGLALQALVARHARIGVPFGVFCQELHLRGFLNRRTLIDASRAELTPFDPLPDVERAAVDELGLLDPSVPDELLFPVYIRLSRHISVNELLSALDAAHAAVSAPIVREVWTMSTGQVADEAEYVDYRSSHGPQKTANSSVPVTRDGMP
jgi:hypothetical protein